MAQPEGIDNFTVGVSVVVGALVVAVMVYLSQAMYYSFQYEDEQAKREAGVGRYAGDLQIEQQARLTGYRWKDREHGRVSIPIERAMALVVAEQAKSQQAQMDDDQSSGAALR